MLELRTRHGVLAGLIALALHVGVFASLPETKSPGAIALGVGGVAFAVSLSAGRAGSDAEHPQRETTPLSAPEAAILSPDAMAAPVEVIPVDVRPDVSVNVPPEQPVPIVPASEVVAVVEVSNEVPVIEHRGEPKVQRRPRPALQKPLPPSRPVATRLEVVKKTPPRTIQAATPASNNEPPKRKSTRGQVKSPATTTKEAQTAPGTIAGEPKEESVARAANAGAGRVSKASNLHGGDLASLTGGGAVKNPSSDYMNQLRYWLNRHKAYPKDARRRRMQGVAYLYFRVTRDGEVLAYKIRKSSGYAMLDREAEEMLKRAKPLPRFPDSMQGGYLDITVPVAFSLRGNR